MTLIVPLKILFIFFLFLPKMSSSSEFHSMGVEQTSFIINICKYYGPKSIIFLYAKSIKEMEITTLMFKWRRALSREGIPSTNLYFSQLQESSYYLEQAIRPYYIVLISNFNAINEFSLATSTFDMSSAVWLVIFIYEENSTDYCHNPPGNIFHLKFNTEMMIRCGTENILREWYSIDTNQIEINDVATWSLERGITKMVPDFLYKRRYNLQGLIMRAIIVKGSTFINLKEGGEVDNELLKEICVALNFSLDIISEAKEFGRWNPKENAWTGAIAELHAGRADISLASFSITSDRLNVVDFALPHVMTKNYLYIRKQELFAIEWSSHFLTFSITVWMAMFGILIVATILLVFIKIRNGTDRKISHLLIDNFLEIWGIFCQQGLDDFTHIFSLRITYFSIFLLIIVFWAGYSASLISILTSVDHILPFNSLEGFVEDGTYQLVITRGTAFYDKFANSKDPFAKKVMKLMIKEEKLPVTELDGFNRTRFYGLIDFRRSFKISLRMIVNTLIHFGVIMTFNPTKNPSDFFAYVCKNRKLVIYTTDQVNKKNNIKLPCNVVRIETGHLHNFAMILSKHNPFTDVINFQMQKLIDNGMMNRLKYRIFKKKSSDMKKLQPISLISVISLIFFFSIGIILSLCILIVEKCIHKRKNNSIIHRNPSIKSSVFYIKKEKIIKNIAKDDGNSEGINDNFQYLF